MSEQTANGVGRRTFMKGVGTVAGASLLGLGAGTAAADGTSFDRSFANWRVREASKVWERGFTGRHDRTIGLTDSGIEARHPDLGPWNGVLAETNGGQFSLKSVDSSMEEVAVTEPRELSTRSFSGTTGPGAAAVGLISTTSTFEIGTKGGEDGSTTDRLEATLSWNADTPGPQANDADFELQDANGNPVASSGSGGTETQESNTETISTEKVEPGEEYQFAVTCWRGAVNWTIDAVTQELVETGETETKEVVTTSDLGDEGVFDDPSNKTFGWFDAGPRYGSYERPRDGNGHGTHCTSIMGGTGQASVVDEATLTQEEPRAALVPGDFLEYEVPVDADGGVFVAAYGENVQVSIEGPDGRTIETGGINADHSLFDNTLIDHPAVHDQGTKSYTAYVKPMVEPESGTATVGRANRVAAGALLPESEAGEGSRDGDATLHAGVAPNAGVVGLQGLSAPTAALGNHADEFASAFNMRAVNMSWGYTGGAPIGAAGGAVSEAAFGENLPARLRDIAHGGILACAAAGNAATPANGNGDPAVADEAISVAATDPVDGLVSYSSGGIGGVDEDASDGGDSQAYTKPDVTAPGGAADGYPAGAYDLVRAAKNGAPGTGESEQDIRDYTLKAGTSMAAPYVTGVAGLVSEAMEEAAPASIALPEPAGTGYADVMRLKQVLLATATQTAFTAAPFHHPTHRPTYRHGERDPYEGFGRVNPDAAVDAVSRDLLPEAPAPEGITPEAVHEASHDERVGLNVPEDSRAVAGFVEVRGGTLDVSVAHQFYSGGNKSMAKGAPHVDLFVYDAENPAGNGEPNAVASAMGMQGSASVSVDLDRRTTRNDEFETRTFYVVAKLVNVPGAVNTHDVQSNLSLDIAYGAAAQAPLPTFSVRGMRADDGSAFTGGATNQVDVTLSGFSTPEGVSIPDGTVVTVRDICPAAWEIDTRFGDVTKREGDVVELGTTTVGAIRNGEIERTYFAEAPNSTGQYTFGAAEVELDADAVENDTATFGGTDTNTVAGANQSQPTESASGTTSTTSGTDTGGTSTSDATDTVSETTDTL